MAVSILEQMFEMALLTKNVKAIEFALEWKKFEDEYKKQEEQNEIRIGHDDRNLINVFIS